MRILFILVSLVQVGGGGRTYRRDNRELRRYGRERFRKLRVGWRGLDGLWNLLSLLRVPGKEFQVRDIV